MTRLLHIEASPRGDGSASSRIAEAFLTAYRDRCPDVEVDRLDVWREDLPEFDPAAIGVKYKLVSGAEMDEHEAAVHAAVESLIGRVRAADRLVLSTPMWNWSVPYKLKQFIDLVSQRDRLFTFDGEAYGPGLDLERALLVCARGQGRGTPAPVVPDRDHHLEYLRFWLEVIGTRRVEVINVDHTWDDRATETVAAGVARARALAGEF